MGKSILQEERVCYLCGSINHLEKHHIFAGVANRKISEREGLWCWLCGHGSVNNCHTGTEGAQYDKEKNRMLKADAQWAYEQTHSRSEWMKLIGKNYL